LYTLYCTIHCNEVAHKFFKIPHMTKIFMLGNINENLIVNKNQIYISLQYARVLADTAAAISPTDNIKSIS
jgi:hypothetical protein